MNTMAMIEFHDNEIDNTAQGTLGFRCGHNGTIEFAYQVEMWIQEMFGDHPSITRAYALSNGVVLAAWYRNSDRQMHYVARHPNYDGQWELPHLYPEATKLATATLGREVVSLEDAKLWATAELKRREVACAILLDEVGMLMAWERSPEGPVLVARSPRPLKETLPQG